MVELKPCPFCGRKPSKVREHKYPSISTVFYTVDCKNAGSKCGVRPTTNLRRTREEAIAAWNKRVETDPFKLVEIDHVRRAEDGK